MSSKKSMPKFSKANLMFFKGDKKFQLLIEAYAHADAVREVDGKKVLDMHGLALVVAGPVVDDPIEPPPPEVKEVFDKIVKISKGKYNEPPGSTT